MKFSAVALIAVATVVSAQGIADIPACAQTCLLPALQATGCSLTDFKCSCSNKSFVSDSTDCIEKGCSAADIAKAAKATYELCKAAGVEIVTRAPPSAPTTSSAAAAPSTTAAAPSTTAPAPASSSSAAAVPTYGEVSSSTKAAEPSTTAAAPSSYAPVPTTVISTTAAGNGTQTQPPVPTYTGGAAVVAGNVVLALGGAVAAFFL